MKIIFENDELCVKYLAGNNSKKELKITFNSHIPKERLAIVESNPLKGGWEAELTKLGAPSIFIIEKKNSWFNFPILITVLYDILEVRREYDTCTLIGASLGGHASLKFAKILNADLVISISPQFCVNPKSLSFETRWKEDTNKIENYIFPEISEHTIAGKIYLIVDDNHNLDMQHADLIMEKIDRATVIKLSDSGHSSARALYDLGFLDRILSNSLNENLSFLDILEREYNETCEFSPTVIKIKSERMNKEDVPAFIDSRIKNIRGHERHIAQLKSYSEKITNEIRKKES